MKYVSLQLILAGMLASAAAFTFAADDKQTPDASRPAKAATAATEASQLEWLPTLAQAYTVSQRTRRPILVRAGAESCAYCRVLEGEMQKPAVAKELERWICVELDVDESPTDAVLLGVSATPALRLLTSSGKQVAAEDGVVEADDLVAWLSKHHDDAAGESANRDENEGPPKTVDIVRIVRQFQSPDAVAREAAVRRLLPYPDLAAAAVASAFEDGSLSTRLASLELLTEWKAPIEKLDPWQPETLTAERLKQISDWANDPARASQKTAGAKTELTPEELDAARKMMAKLVTAQPIEAEAIRERLARFGKLLLPEVYAQLPEAETDTARERLTELRYRLVATEALMLSWPGGLNRLSATDSKTRETAANELARRAVADDVPLLLELFSDPAPLVREISLRVLRTVGGKQASSALVKLLDDPEPNVRAAVLKQLAEKPNGEIIKAVAEYAGREEDSDLVVHAVRVLKEGRDKVSTDGLLALLKHKSWRVRAEAAEAIGASISDRYGSSGDENTEAAARKTDALMAMVELLKDEDAFVVSRAVGALASANLAAAAVPMVQAAEAHPDLAHEVIESLSQNHQNAQLALPHLRKFSTHELPKVRAAAVTGLCTLAASECEKELAASLVDKDETVRIAGGMALFNLLEQGQRSAFSNVGGAHAGEDGVRIEVTDDGEELAPTMIPSRPGLFDRMLDVFRGGPSRPARTRPVPVEIRAEPTAIADVEDTEPVVAQKPLGHKSSGLSNARGEHAEQVLRDIRAGKVHQKWQFDLADELKPLLAGKTPVERFAGALPLIALGHDTEVLPALYELLATGGEAVGQASKALEWLPWETREPLFHKLVEVAKNSTEVQTVLRGMYSTTFDTRVAPLMWNMLATDAYDPKVPYNAVNRCLKSLYSPNQSYEIREAPARERQAALADAMPRAKEGTRWQRIMGLAICIEIAFDDTSPIARSIFEDVNQDAALRANAFQLLLSAQQKREATETAIAGMKSDLEAIRGLSLRYLAGDSRSLMTLPEGGFQLMGDQARVVMRSSTNAKPELPKAPEGLTAEALTPFLTSKDPDLIAYAAYLLALLDDGEQVDVLIAQWRQRPDSETLQQLVYRAIAHFNDGSRVAILESIYDLMRAEEDTQRMQELYWTIRTMTGPEILALRKRMREEVGMEHLR